MLRSILDGVAQDRPLPEVLATVAELTAAALGPCHLRFNGASLGSATVAAGGLGASGRATVTSTIEAGPLRLSFAVWLPPASAGTDHSQRTVARACDLARVALVAEEARWSRRARPDTDPLTGAMNRSGVSGYLAGAGAAGWVGGLAVIAVDLDGLKRIGDRHGHAGGDHVLMGAADRLRSAVGGDGIVARVGGDEFVVACLGLTDPRAVDARAETIRTVLAEPYRFGTVDEVCTATVGVVVSHAEHDWSVLRDRAFDAVHVGKVHGGNRVERWIEPPGWYVAGGYQQPEPWGQRPTVIAPPATLEALLLDATAGGWPGRWHAVVAFDIDDATRLVERFGSTGAQQRVTYAARWVWDAKRPVEVLAQTGPDEFVVVCPGLAGPEVADTIAARVHRAIRRVPVERDLGPLTATVGVAVSDDAGDLPALLERAWSAVRVGKATGKNRVVRWDATTPPG